MATFANKMNECLRYFFFHFTSTFYLTVNDYFGSTMQMKDGLRLLLLNSDKMGVGFPNKRGVFRIL